MGRAPLSFLIYLFLLLGCGSRSDAPKLRIETGDSLVHYELSPTTYAPLNVSIYEQPRGDFLINNNFSHYDTVNQLELYDLENGGLVHRIELIPKEFGYLRKIKEYQYLDHDSIFFAINGARDPWITHYIRIDSTGRMLDRWSIDGSTEKAPDFRTGGTMLFPPIRYRDRTIFTFHLVEGTDLDERSVFDTSPMTMIHLSDSGRTELERFGRYPTIYLKGDREYLPHRSVRKLIPYPLNLFDYAIGNEELVLSFPACDTLYRYDLDGEYLGKRTAKSGFASPQNLWSELRKKGANIQKDHGPHFSDLPHYTSLTHDPHRDLYYRMLSFGDRWALMILSEELEVLDEIEIDREGPFLSTPLPTEEHVLIRKNNTEDLVFFPLRIERKNESPS